VPILIRLFTFDARFFRLSVAQNAPPAGFRPLVAHFVPQREKLRIRSEQAYFLLHGKFHINSKRSKRLINKQHGK